VRLHGTLRLPAGGVGQEGAVARVRLLDVSRADASAVTVAETRVRLASDARSAEVDFELEAPALDPGATYSLAAHVDLSSSGDVTQGDLVTTQHIDVAPGDEEPTYDVPLHKVT
jgi:hypothetical protein